MTRVEVIGNVSDVIITNISITNNHSQRTQLDSVNICHTVNTSAFLCIINSLFIYLFISIFNTQILNKCLLHSTILFQRNVKNCVNSQWFELFSFLLSMKECKYYLPQGMLQSENTLLPGTVSKWQGEWPGENSVSLWAITKLLKISESQVSKSIGN